MAEGGKYPLFLVPLISKSGIKSYRRKLGRIENYSVDREDPYYLVDGIKLLGVEVPFTHVGPDLESGKLQVDGGPLHLFGSCNEINDV